MKRKTKEERIEILTEEQVLLAKERTILSFMQTGLAFIGAGVVIISIFNEILPQIVGYGLMIIGVLEVVESFKRLRRKQAEMHALKEKLR